MDVFLGGSKSGVSVDAKPVDEQVRNFADREG
jgi:hypothetical protein